MFKPSNRYGAVHVAYPNIPPFMNWSVYIILCSDDSLYTGITTEPERRFRQHSDGRGAKYFRARRPSRIVYLEQGHTRSTAGSRERQIKNMTRQDKCILISSAAPLKDCVYKGRLSQDLI